MANQINIDIGAAANDGTGDPLRTAFNYVNLNFANVWDTGLPNSNVQFNNNRILTVNTNANLVLAPNGTGVVQSNVSVVPNIDRVHNLGSIDKRWDTVNTYYVNASSANIGSFGNLTVSVANLHITGGSNGYVLQTDGAGNLTWTAQTGGGGNGIPGGANTQVQYNNAGSFGGSAAFTFDRTANLLTVVGNISAAYINVANNVNAINDVFAKRGTFTGDPVTGDASLYIGSPTFTNLGTDVMAQFTGNVPAYAQINLQNYGNSPTASGDYIITADNGNDTTHFLDLGLTSSTWDGTQPNSLGNRLGPNDGYLYVQDGDFVLGTSNGTIETWKFGQDGVLTVAGDILPAANNTQSLGSATSQWSDLYISNATIFMNGVPISLGAGNVLTVNGADVVTNANGQSSIGNLDIIGTDITIAAGASETQINISPNGESWSYLQLPNDATANLANVRLHNDAGNIEIATGDFSTGSTSYNWYFDNTGNLNIPGAIISASSIDIDNRASGNTADIRLYSADDIILQARDRTLGSGTEGGDINIYAGDSAEDGDASGGDIQIFAGDGGAANVDFGGAGGFITIRAGQGGSAIGDGVSVAESGGSLTLEAGDAGGNSGNIDRGADGGDVYINAGESTGNLAAGGDIVLTTGPGGSNAPAGNLRIAIPSSDLGAGGTWTFGHNGNLTLPNNGNINGADGQTARFQTTDEGEFRAGITLTPGFGLTRLESFDNQNSNGYTTSDWNTGEYINNGGSGEIVFTDAPSIISFFSTVDNSRVFYQVNGGNLLPSAGFGSGGNNITFYTAIPPAASPETVTSFTIYYSNRSAIEMDYDEGEMNLIARDLDINITSDQSIDLVTRDIIRLQNTGNSSGVAVITDAGNAFHTWNFLPTGNLTLPLGGVINEGPSPSYLGNAVTITPAGGNDPNQQLKIYPTFAEGNHLHLTSGNLAVTDVFLGDDSQYIRTTTTGGMTVGTGGGEISGGYVWSFEENGNLIFPDGASIGSGAFNGTASSTVSLNAFSPDGNTVSFQAQGNTSSAVISIFSNAGPVTSNWTFTTAPLDPSESFLYVPNGGAISTPAASGGEGGKNIFIQAGASDPVTWNSNPGGELMLKGGYGSFGDGGGGPGGNVNIEGGASSDSHAGNVNITCGPNSWVFDYSGNVTIPGNINAVVSSPAPSLNGFTSVNAVTVNASGNITGGNILGNGASMTGVATKTTGTWNVTAGTATYSFTVSPNGVYQLWVNGNIPNGIIVYNATVSVSNTNVPVIGQQFAWNYEGAGNPIVFTSIPAQIIGTAGAISNASPSVGTTTNTFEFGINNSSGNTVTVNWGYTKIS